MPGSGDDAERVKGDHPRIVKLCLHLRKCLVGMRRQVHAGETQRVSMLHDVDEGDDAGPALRGIEPIAAPGIIADVGLALIPDENAVEGVVEDRNPNKKQLQEKNEGQAVQKRDLPAIGLGAFEGFSVRDEVFEKECSDRHDAAERVQTAQQKRGSLAGAQRSDTLFDFGSDFIGSAGTGR